MKTIKYTQRKLITMSLVIAVLLGISLLWSGSARAATLPAETCAYDLGTNTRTCEFWATTGTLTLPGGVILPIWGYTDIDPSLGGLASLPGPAIIANQGEILQVILHNSLAETTSLYFSGQDVIPDLAGVTAGGITTYSFTLNHPGTFSYEAGLLESSQHQVAMGLFGALVVRPAGLPGQAFADPTTAFTDEALVLLSEIDPALNNLANPALFDLRDYNPRYFLINGKSYPETDLITSAVSGKVLLRYINAGLQPHTMNLLGLDQTFIGFNGNQLPYAREVVVNTVHPGQSADMLVSLPSVTPAGGGTYALYDGSFLTRNSNAPGFGGMLTFISVADGTVPSTGPSTGFVSLTPNPTNGSVDVAIQATVSGPLTVSGAEYFIGATGAGGTGISMAALDGAFDSLSETAVATLSVADLALLTSGDHTISVHGTDGVWGSFNFGVLHLDKLGPMVSGITLSPDPSNGTLAVSIRATADDMMYGNSNVVAAEYVIDNMMMPATPMTVSPVSPMPSLTAVISSVDMGMLTEGEHMLYIRAQDAFGNWGDWMMGMAALRVDQTGPVAQNLVLTPSLLYTRAQVRLDVTLADLLSGTPGVQSRVQKAEGFINTVGAPGTGFPLTPSDGLFNTSSEKAWAIIPLATINSLPEGENTIYVRGRDTSGNWGATSSAILTIMPQTIFSDGFESGSFSAWLGGTGGTPTVSTAAARTGTYGMQVVLSGNTPGYAIDLSPTAEPSYRGRFYFNPNATVTGNNNQITIFAGLDGANATLFQVQYNRTNQGTTRVRAVVTRLGGTSTSPWVTISSNTFTAIEISWQSATSSTFRLYTGGVLRSTLSGLNTNAYKLETVWLGPSGTLANQSSGTLFFDDFVSKRTLYIGL